MPILRAAAAAAMLAAAVPAAASRPPAPAAADAAEAELLGLAGRWVQAWNDRDVDAMARLQADDLTYGVFGLFDTGPRLLAELRAENFWGLSWSVRMEAPRVRRLDGDTALVLFRLVGTSRGAGGERPYRSLFTLVFQRRAGAWKIVHVHDSEAPPAATPPPGGG